jgi:hypothetical protein
MRRRIFIWAGLFIVLGVSLLTGYWFARPHPRIDQATVDKIQPGMTEQEVIDIIGAPPGNYGLGHGEMDEWVELIRTMRIYNQTGNNPWFEPAPLAVKDWLGQEHGIRVSFDPQGNVVRADFNSVWREYDSHYDMILVWCRLKDRRSRTPLVISTY